MVKKVSFKYQKQEIIFGDRAHPFVLLAGPCVLESQDRALKIGNQIKVITEKLGIPFVFKASFDKANRSSIESYRGPGLKKGLTMLAQIKEKLKVPVITDIHLPEQAAVAAEIVDIIQIPAFLSRQTDLLAAAGKTQKVVNVKKGQFLAPADLEQVVKKITSTGNHKILLTERGTCFGYNNLVVDMRGLVRMRQIGYPVVFDATHSVQLPGGAGDSSTGERQYVFPLARAACAVGVDAFFMEVHDRSEEALCDGPNMVKLEQLPEILRQLAAIVRAVH